MASVFLSYVREDAERARALAVLLERAGHSVWWDRRIKGGAQYSNEIEAALGAADKVVVLWSAASVRSAWVRDEAAAGRDTERLIPVALDSTPAPLGFRQFQTIDLSEWKGRSAPPNLHELCDAIGGGEVAKPTAKTSLRRQPTPRRSFTLARILPILLLLVLVGIGGWWWTSRGHAATPVVAINAGDGSDRSRDVARQLAISLGDLQSARNDAFQLVSGSGQADLRLQVDAVDGSQGLRRDLSVVSGANNSILWSTSLRQPRGKDEELSEQLTLTSEQVLSCALDALSDRQDRIDPTTLKSYLTGCSRFATVYGVQAYDPTLVNLFEQVIRKAPHFEGAWAKLLASEFEIARNPDPPPALVNRLRQHIEQAENLGIQIGELYAAKAALLPTSNFLGTFALYDQGIRADPDNAFLYRVRSERLQGVGRMNDSVYDANQALKLDPLSPALTDNLISALAYSGQVEAAYDQLRKAEAKWPAARNLPFARYRLDLRFGDPKEGLTLYKSGLAGDVLDPAQESFLEARIDPAPQKIQRAIDAERQFNAQEPRAIFGLMQALGQFGRKDEAINVLLNYKRVDALGYNSEVLFRPAMREIWRDPRSIAAAAHVGLLTYWKKSGQWPDFCFDPTLPYDCKKEAAKYRV